MLKKTKKEEDREMLLLAAKSVGYTVYSDLSGDEWICVSERGRESISTGIRSWNPLHSNFDAFRLAADHRMTVSFFLDGAEADCESLETACQEDGEPCMAARRAIVRAAALVWKGTH